MSRHTPGPWVVTDTRNGGRPGIRREVLDEKGNVVQCEQVYPFYACAPEDRDFPRHEADARLIAESPEMFELLQQIVEAADDQDNEDDSELVECINWERIRAVVARVEGKQVGT